jgi:hypothetical protein
MKSLLTMALSAAALVTPVGRARSVFTLRDLVCRGKPGIDVKVDRSPSPDDPRSVRMVLHFGKATPPVGSDYENLAPGTCSWNPANMGTVPHESLVVYFDVAPQAQLWSSTGTRDMDTTVNAAIFFKDTISIPRYFSQADHYWRFYVDDQTNFSNSHGAIKTTVTHPTYVTLTGPFGKPAPAAPVGGVGGERNPGSPSQATTRSQPGSVGQPRSPGAPKTAATATLAKLTFKGIDRKPDGFTVRFTARPNASVSVNYGTGRPVNTPGGWYLEGAAVQGSGAVSRGGFMAEVQQGKPGGVFSEYTGASRLPLTRATAYSFIITVQGANGPMEQYVGQFKSMQQDIKVAITSFELTKPTPFKGAAEHGSSLFADSVGGRSYCGREQCTNVRQSLGLMIWASPPIGVTTAPAPTSWTQVSGHNSGVGKVTIDLNTLSPTHPFRSFSIRSMPGDVEFEAQGTIEATWH